MRDKMNTFRLSVIIGMSALLAACSQPDQPREIRPQPVFDKFGGGSCVGGFVYVAGAAPGQAECIPEEDCNLGTAADGSVSCLPPSERRPDDSSDGEPGREPQDPTGGPRT